jgi:hypothetical protein
MTTLAATAQPTITTAQSTAYERFSGVCAILAGALTLLYSLSFIFLVNETLSSFCLLAIGLLASVVLVGLYARVKDTDGSFALWALLLGLVGAIGSALHGGYDLAAVLVPHAPVDPNLPSAVDPRGLLTFGVMGIAVWVFAWLTVHGGRLPKALGYLGYVVAALQIVLYLGRLIVFDARNPGIVIPALLAGFIATPLWYIWLGISLWRGARA